MSAREEALELGNKMYNGDVFKKTKQEQTKILIMSDTSKETEMPQFVQTGVSGCYVGTQTPIERLRNKLTPFLTLIDLLERNENMVLPFLDDDDKNDLFESCLDTCIKYKQDIKTHLSDCDVFYNNH